MPSLITVFSKGRGGASNYISKYDKRYDTWFSFICLHLLQLPKTGKACLSQRGREIMARTPLVMSLYYMYGKIILVKNLHKTQLPGPNRPFA